MYSLFTTLLYSFFLCGCKSSEEEMKIPPTNLVISTVISTDGLGSVVFTATAENATSYEYDFGNGEVKTVPFGIINYKYTIVGTKTYTVTVTATNGELSIKKSTEVTITVNAPGTTLIWSDEFDTDGSPDSKKWGYDLGDGCPNNCGWGNNELEYYTDRPENVIIKGGLLKINAIKENYKGKAYTSTRMLSKDKFAFTYGKVEVRAKIPAGVGTWPAIWMLGSNISTAGWPACGEIDIMEHVGKELNKIYGTLHYPGRFGGNADGNTKVIANATTEFHIYTLDWSASAIKIYADNQLIHSVVNYNAIPFNHDFFIIMNVAMGGNFGGPVDAAVTGATMEVDYIRVYK